MKKYTYQTLLASCLLFASYTAHAEKLEFTVYNNSPTQTYIINIIKSCHYDASFKSNMHHDQVTNKILNPGAKYTYSKNHDGQVVGLEYIKITNNNDPNSKDPKKIAEFKRKAGGYKPKNVTITDNSDGSPNLAVTTNQVNKGIV
jgi:hypothetical protein